MSQIFHPNVVLFMGASTDPKEKLMVVTVSWAALVFALSWTGPLFRSGFRRTCSSC